MRIPILNTEVPSRPDLFIVTGLIGTGKSTVAEGLADRMGLDIIISDVVRKRLANIPPTEHRFEEFGSGIYSADFSRRTYDEMFREVRELLSQGRSVVMDATFRKAAERRRAAELAREMMADFWVIECIADDNMVRERLERRLREERSVSDGRWEIFEEQKRDFDKVDEFPAERHLVIDTSVPIDEVMRRLLEEIAARKASRR